MGKSEAIIFLGVMIMAHVIQLANILFVRKKGFRTSEYNDLALSVFLNALFYSILVETYQNTAAIHKYLLIANIIIGIALFPILNEYYFDNMKSIKSRMERPTKDKMSELIMPLKYLRYIVLSYAVILLLLGFTLLEISGLFSVK